MPSTTSRGKTINTLTDVTRVIQLTEGFPPLLEALRHERSATVDGAWGSSAALVTAALGVHATKTLLVVLAHPRDLDAWAGDVQSFSGTTSVTFPAWDHLPDEDTVADEVAGQRLRLLKTLAGDSPPRFVFTTIQALIQPVPDKVQLEASKRVLRVGQDTDLDELSRWLLDRGYRRADAVELPGEFSRRGGIFDLFSPDADAPYRLEFFGDEIESIRQFSPQTQRSLGEMPSAEVMSLPALSATTSPAATNGEKGIARGALTDYLAASSWVVLVEPEDLSEAGKHYLERVSDPVGLFSVPGVMQQLLRFPSVTISTLPRASVEATCHLRVESVERFSGNIGRVRDELDAAAAGDRVLIACHNEAECKRLGEVLAAGQLAQTDRLRLVTGRVRAGFRMIDPTATTSANGVSGVVVLGSQELFHRDENRQVLPRRRLESRAIDSFLDLAEGDLVVHVSHGIARYHGMQILDRNGHSEEHLTLEFAGGVRLYVPASKIDLVQKYVGGAKTDPELSKLGGTSWENKKQKVQQSVLDLAAEMVDLQALREAKAGIALPPDSEWQAEFEASFPYEETADQLTSLGEIKRDMQRGRPMDRLLCGDVGYGKTELADSRGVQGGR